MTKKDKNTCTVERIIKWLSQGGDVFFEGIRIEQVLYTTLSSGRILIRLDGSSTCTNVELATIKLL